MKAFAKVFVLSACLYAPISQAQTVYYNVQCWAEGHKFRVNSGSVKDQLTSSRLLLNIKADGDKVVLKEYLGHISGASFVDGSDELTEVGFYSVFQSKEDEVLESSLAPRARKYKDESYWRFKDFSDSVSSSDDGGGMSGYLVVSKKYNAEGYEKFGAHYVFQHGDHTGGTIDFTCLKH